MKLAVRSVVVGVLTVLLTSACGESPTAPSSQIPNVAGTYTDRLPSRSMDKRLGQGRHG